MNFSFSLLTNSDKCDQPNFRHQPNVRHLIDIKSRYISDADKLKDRPGLDWLVRQTYKQSKPVLE